MIPPDPFRVGGSRPPKCFFEGLHAFQRAGILLDNEMRYFRALSNWRFILFLLGVSLNTGCRPQAETGAGVEEFQAQLEIARKERDSLLEKLDASTRERVDLDGELNRLRKELETLKAEKPEKPAP